MLFGQDELATNLESKKELKSRMYRSALASLNHSDMENMTDFSDLCVWRVFMRLSRRPPVKVL